MWEWLATQDVDKVANSLIAFLAALAVAMGFKKPAKDIAPQIPPSTMEIATDFFDAEAIGTLTREITGLALAATGALVAAKDQTAVSKAQVDAINASTASVNRLCDIALKWMEDQEEAEERRLERRAELAELEAERHRRENEELRRRVGLDPMRKD